MPKLHKSAQISAQELSAEDLALINNYTLNELTADQVYTFRLTLCDNEIDRAQERFTVDALKTLSDLFLGRTIIADHNWSSAQQTARIYRTEVVQEEGVTTKAGEPYTKLVANAYMVRTESNGDLIQEIQAGIKKEVSVGCAVARVTCSVCGCDYRSCGHWAGKAYDGTRCHKILGNPTDAYEVSFVAVPAQRKAGVTKAYEDEDADDTGTDKNTPDNTDETAEKAVQTDIDLLDVFIFHEKQKG